MNANQAIENALDTALMISMGYLSDLTDEEMMHRPDPGCNHIKWQLGHLIVADNQMINGCRPATLDELPEEFVARYAKEKSKSDSPQEFDSKDDLMAICQAQHSKIKKAIQTMSESDFDQPAPESMKDYAATWGAAFNMIGGHWLMHAGQWAVIRRQKGRAPLF